MLDQRLKRRNIKVSRNWRPIVTGPEDPLDTEEPLTPEEEAEIEALNKKTHDAHEFLRDLEKSGWQGGPDGLFDPRDPEVSVWFNPLTAEILLSPKFIDRIKTSFPALPKP